MWKIEWPHAWRSPSQLNHRGWLAKYSWWITTRGPRRVTFCIYLLSTRKSSNNWLYISVGCAITVKAWPRKFLIAFDKCFKDSAHCRLRTASQWDCATEPQAMLICLVWESPHWKWTWKTVIIKKIDAIWKWNLFQMEIRVKTHKMCVYCSRKQLIFTSTYLLESI